MGLKVDISEFSDFCFGVKRAIALAEKALKKQNGPVFSFGPLIHNKQVVVGLSKEGLAIVDDLKEIKKGTVVIRTHGITPAVFEEIRKIRINIVDATCPFVKNAQTLAEKLSGEGYMVVIVGDKDHPEVKSLKGFAGDKASVITDSADVRKLKLKNAKIGVISQTTRSLSDFLAIIQELLKKNFSEVRIFNTICGDAHKRQQSTEECSKNNDLVIVVGGKDSANTKRLYDICRRMGTPARQVETASEIRDAWLKGKKTVGIVSGASTPRWIVNGVVGRLKKYTDNRR